MPATRRKKKVHAKRKARPKSRRRVARKRVVRKKVAARPKKRRVSAKKRDSKKRHVVKQVERASVERVLTGHKRKKRSGSARRSHRRVPQHVMAGTRRRSVGKKSNSGLLIGLGIGALAFYLLSKKSPTQYPTYPQLPPLNTTSNYQRNQQQDSILQYALAASLGIDAISKLITSLNNSSDNDVQSIYDHVNTTGTLPDTVYV